MGEIADDMIAGRCCAICGPVFYQTTRDKKRTQRSTAWRCNSLRTWLSGRLQRMLRRRLRLPGSNRKYIIIMKQITEEMKVHDQWYIDARSQTTDTLQAFIQHLLNDYQHDYGTICHAITAASIATASAINKSDQGGITGFQAGAIMWEFITHWNHESNKCGLRLVDYDNMLYPQYQEGFEKTISYEVWLKMQEQARKLFNENKNAAPAVVGHWKSIIDGIIPFGYKVKDL